MRRQNLMATVATLEKRVVTFQAFLAVDFAA
jgi:hypothetical protein